jgi:ASC-1-like (ASCH) protein/GNAT superfamily N-acetyltransferase
MLPGNDEADLTGQMPPLVRNASAADTAYVIEAFEHALRPFYGGDHAAHARRLVDTHLAGGEDPRGLLSTRQLLMVLWQGGQRVGLLNLVFKGQATCKISPLILYPSNHRNRGLGATLLNAAEDEARKAGARQLYCTVAKENHDALAFFRQCGFVDCGRSEGQYKDGHTEILLRRSLCPPEDESDRAGLISVAEVGDNHDWLLARSLLLDGIAGHVDGADVDWLESLRAGVSVHCEPTWVFGAKDRLGRHRGAAIVTRKKGDAVKVMPIAAADADAFRALIVDLPELLAERGRKVYVHIAPDPGEVAVLQEAGWEFEALLPGAYSDGVVTQQWGCPLGKDALLKRLRIRESYLDMIAKGQKTLEVRVGYDHVRSIRTGDQLKLFSRTSTMLCDVADVRNYDSFADLLSHEDVDRILPGTDSHEALRLLRTIYPPDKEKLGIVVFVLKPSGR